MRKWFVIGCLLLVVEALDAQPDSSSRAVRVYDLTISGASQTSRAELQGIEEELKQRCCSFAEREEIRERIRYAFEERGYYKVEIDQLEVKAREVRSGPPSVAVSVRVREGLQYRLKSIAFTGERAFPSDQLRQQFAIADGDIFNAEKIRAGLTEIRRLYWTEGYINFVPVANSEPDDVTSTITLMIDVDEGKQFRLGGLLLDGEEPHAGDGTKLLEAWRPMQGKVYDIRKIEQWWQLAATMLPPGTRLEQSLVLKQDPQSHMVTAFLSFPVQTD